MPGMVKNKKTQSEPQEKKKKKRNDGKSNEEKARIIRVKKARHRWSRISRKEAEASDFYSSSEEEYSDPEDTTFEPKNKRPIITTGHPYPTPSPTPCLTANPTVTNSVPDATTPAPNITIPAPYITTPAPDITTPTPDITMPAPDIATPGPDVSDPTSPKASSSTQAPSTPTAYSPRLAYFPLKATEKWSPHHSWISISEALVALGEVSKDISVEKKIVRYNDCAHKKKRRYEEELYSVSKSATTVPSFIQGTCKTRSSVRLGLFICESQQTKETRKKDLHAFVGVIFLTDKGEKHVLVWNPNHTQDVLEAGLTEGMSASTSILPPSALRWIKLLKGKEGGGIAAVWVAGKGNETAHLKGREGGKCLESSRSFIISLFTNVKKNKGFFKPDQEPHLMKVQTGFT